MRGSPRIKRIKRNLDAAGISDYRLFYGVNGEKSGLKQAFHTNSTTLAADILSEQSTLDAVFRIGCSGPR